MIDYLFMRKNHGLSRAFRHEFKGDLELALLPALANRHGLITGATGTGKTVTLQVMAERFSSIGVPVFMADVKGDLAGMSQPGASSPEVCGRSLGEGARWSGEEAEPTRPDRKRRSATAHRAFSRPPGYG